MSSDETKENDISCACEDLSLEVVETQETLSDKIKRLWKVYAAALLLGIGLLFDYYDISFFTPLVRLAWYGVAYVLVGGSVILSAVKLLTKKDLFNEFFLMSIATIGAFAIGEYAEGVGVMLFYTIGELVQDAAVNAAKRSIQSLINVQQETAIILQNGIAISVPSREVELGSTIRVNAGAKVALDGVLLSDSGQFNTSSLTGESMPRTIKQGKTVLAGMINTGNTVEVKTTARFEDTRLSKILDLVQHATNRKARTQRFISKFAKIYTPVVVALAIALLLIPALVVDNYVFSDWLYRALVFLVISCPCAFVISIPLGYFGGIGAASRKGILFKGANYLDEIARVDTVVFDKTGTLTQGSFKVNEVEVFDFDKNTFIQLVAALERNSNHPIAKAISEYAGHSKYDSEVTSVEEFSGKGMFGKVGYYNLVVGNEILMKQFDIWIPESVNDLSETVVLVSINNRITGFICIADTLKDSAIETIGNLKDLGITQTIILSGDKQPAVDNAAKVLKVNKAIGELLPEGKYEYVQEACRKGRTVAFVGDGVNDAPVLAISNVGIAMGGLGSDVAIDTADVVIQDDNPAKVATAIKIGRATGKIVRQNLGLAFGVKLVVLVIGAAGMATLWEAVFADVGVALLAILNAVRIQRMKF